MNKSARCNYCALALLSVSLIWLPGCYVSFQAPQAGSGKIATETRQIEAFQKLSLAGAGLVTIEYGKPASLELTTDDNLIDLIETKVEKQELFIRATENIGPTMGPEYEISTEKLSQISIAGSADVSVLNYGGDKLQLEIAGAGSFKVEGVCEFVRLAIAGSGNADLTELVAKKVRVEILGSGDAEVNATETLEVSIAGSGNIGYIGQPTIKKSIAGSGDVRQIDGHDSNNTSSADENREGSDD